MHKEKTSAIVTNSRCHIILCVAKFYGHEIGLEELQTINPIKFKRGSDFARDILRLKVNGLILESETNPNHWSITNKGIAYIYDHARRNAGNITD